MRKNNSKNLNYLICIKQKRLKENYLRCQDIGLIVCIYPLLIISLTSTPQIEKTYHNNMSKLKE